LVPRNDTEIMVEKVIESLKLKIKSNEKFILIDV
jgi:methylase of polypeptide subunit release factors